MSFPEDFSRSKSPEDYSKQYERLIKEKVINFFTDEQLDNLVVAHNEAFIDKDDNFEICFYVYNIKSGLKYGVVAELNDNGDPFNYTCAKLPVEFPFN